MDTNHGSARFRAEVARHAWWVIASLIVAVTVGVALGGGGFVMVPLWAAINAAGVWMYCDHHPRDRTRTKQVLKLLAIALLPAGIFGLLSTPGQLSPTEYSGEASPDENTRKDVARGRSLGSNQGLG